jgi:hypothetical protein
MDENGKPPMPNLPSFLAHHAMPSPKTAETGQGAMAQAGPDPGGILSTLLATGASLEEGVLTLEAMGLPTASVVEGVLAALENSAPGPLKEQESLLVLVDLLWKSDDPGAARPVLEAHGLPAIRLLQDMTVREDSRAQALAGPLSGDMSLVRALNDYGAGVPFRHPDGCRYGRPFTAPSAVELWAQPDGCVWAPRDVTCQEGLRLRDDSGQVTRLDLSLDAIRTPANRRGTRISFDGCGALERLPDTVDINPQGTLDLSGCRSFVRLPDRLRIGAKGSLDLTGCVAWDGQIPASADFGPNVVVVLPDGTKTLVETLVAERGEAVKLPRGKGELARKAEAMAKTMQCPYAEALAKLEHLGADHGMVVQILVERLERTVIRSRRVNAATYLSELESALVGAQGLALEAIPQVNWAPDGQMWELWHDPSAFVSWKHLPAIEAHLRVLPKGLLRGQALLCRHLQSLETLPSGSRTGDVYLEDCPAFAFLPGDLRCQGNLRIKACPKWDRILPDGVAVGDRIFTEGHPQGVTLVQWRKKYGVGPGK